MADDNEDPQPEQTADQRIASLEAGQEDLSKKMDKILGLLPGQHETGGDGGGHDEQPTGGSIAHEIRAQLDERDRKAKEDADRSSLNSTVDQLKASVAELSEKPPAPMPRRVERLMGWR